MPTSSTPKNATTKAARAKSVHREELKCRRRLLWHFFHALGCLDGRKWPRSLPLRPPRCRLPTKQTTSLAANPQPESQKLLWRTRATLRDRENREPGSRGGLLVGELITSTHQASPRALRARSRANISCSVPEQEMRSRPPRLPGSLLIPKVLGTSYQEASSPEALVRLGLATQRKLLQASCGAAAGTLIS